MKNRGVDRQHCPGAPKVAVRDLSLRLVRPSTQTRLRALRIVCSGPATIANTYRGCVVGAVVVVFDGWLVVVGVVRGASAVFGPSAEAIM